MSKKRYPVLRSGEPVVINPQKECFRMACCDCNLVHIIEYKVTHRQKLMIRMWRDRRATGQLRRYRGGRKPKP